MIVNTPGSEGSKPRQRKSTTLCIRVRAEKRVRVFGKPALTMARQNSGGFTHVDLWTDARFAVSVACCQARRHRSAGALALRRSRFRHRWLLSFAG
jgi:hypothetical protein